MFIFQIFISWKALKVHCICIFISFEIVTHPQAWCICVHFCICICISFEAGTHRRAYFIYICICISCEAFILSRIVLYLYLYFIWFKSLTLGRISWTHCRRHTYICSPRSCPVIMVLVFVFFLSMSLYLYFEMSWS